MSWKSVICFWNLAPPSFCSILWVLSGGCSLAAFISVSCPLTEKNQVLLFLVLLDSLCFEILQPLSVKGFCSVTSCPLYPTNSVFLYRFFIWTFLKKIFIEFLAVLFLFYIFTFICNSHGILVPRLGIKSAPPALEDEILTTGPPGKSPNKSCLNDMLRCFQSLSYCFVGPVF